MTSTRIPRILGQLRQNRLALAVAATVALGGLLRLILANYSLWYDEYASLYFARRPMNELWGEWMVRETNPPLFYTLLKGWLALGFETRAGIRLLPIAGGIVQVGLLAWICWRWFDRQAAIIVAILGALAPASIYFSHLVRAYIFASDAALVALVGLLGAIEPGVRDRTGPWLLYGAGCTAGIYFHTTMAIWPFAVALALGASLIGRLERFDRGFIGQFIAVNLAILLLSAWWLHISYQQLQGGLQNLAWNKPVGPREFVRLVLGSCFLTIEPYDRDKIVTTLLPLLTVGTIVWYHRDRRLRLLALLFAATLLSFGVLGAFKPIVIQRTLYWISIFPLLITAIGLGRIRSAVWRCGAVLVIGLLLLNNLRVHYHEYQAQDWERALRVLAADPAGVTLIQSASMRSGLSEACRLEFGRPQCPFRVIAVGETVHDPARDPDGWRAAVSALRGALKPADRIYALRSYDYDPFAALGVAKAALPPTGADQFLQGPLTRGTVLHEPG